MTNILAIESSCDDTSVALISDGRILSNVTAGQSVHEQYGGVVPEAASRAHQVHIVPTVHAALRQAGIRAEELSAVAFTLGPGLLGSLLVGVSFAKGLALALGLPLIEVHHIQAHILAHFIEDPKPEFPFLCLTVSGGHTQLVLVRDYFDMEILGSTLDDAAGEAFDKTGKLLGLGYPAGPHIDRLARLGQARFSFSEPQVEGLNFSFSGLKTNVLRFVQKNIKENPNFINEHLNDLCASVQARIVSILLNKLDQAAAQTAVRHLALSGGVSANSGLRQGLQTLGAERGWKVYIPRLEYCTDNAAMIAMTAHFKYLRGEFAGQSVAPRARYDWA